MQLFPVKYLLYRYGVDTVVQIAVRRRYSVQPLMYRQRPFLSFFAPAASIGCESTPGKLATPQMAT